MGGGDLNQKKSWHPSTMKNQERVWKAEQADAAEKRKLAELQQEINDERNREELQSIAKKSGLIPDDGSGDRKLEWMYRGPQVNREEYLLGRTVDKHFEQLDAQERAGPSVGISQPKNHVEHECIPFSIREYKGLEGSEQVDMVRKLMEDPLMAIKQKEVESRQKILQNPVKLKELHHLLKNDDTIKGKKGRKKEKKEKKKKSKKKRRDHSSSSRSASDDSGGDDRDLDKLLTEKYKKVQSRIDTEQNEDINLDKLLSMKYQKLSKELNKMSKSKKSKKKRHQSSSSEDDSSDSERERKVRKRNAVSREKDRSGNPRQRNRSRSLQRKHRSRTRSKSADRFSHRDRNRPRSREHKQSPDRFRKRSPSRDRKNHRTRSVSSSSNSSPEEPRRNPHMDSDEEERRPAKKNFGLVTSSGKKLELNKRDEVKLYKREEIKASQSSQKPSWSRPEKKKILTEEEMEARRREMLGNAAWRDQERQRNVKQYEDDDRRQEEKEGHRKYDKEFVNRQFKHAADNETVERRIKSNRNNIQRAGGSMSNNFARR
ncbi:pre-mRNA-splicing factor CWC25 homolog [Uranotaenia lowii]|uniref:pre-mRNA-splicing factor CWC25 homolog n=1 Tax=Uranotaenia lowii TaxID=190385 RepID=UPI00247A122E|nr:pre-mRNA-splicing factor CWC25 homolog [Uranotaenia lowii]